MTSTSKLPKHVLSITRPNAKHQYQCVWCSREIKAGDKYVRVVWQDDNEVIHSDHICLACWTAE